MVRCAPPPPRARLSQALVSPPPCRTRHSRTTQAATMPLRDSSPGCSRLGRLLYYHVARERLATSQDGSAAAAAARGKLAPCSPLRMRAGPQGRLGRSSGCLLCSSDAGGQMQALLAVSKQPRPWRVACRPGAPWLGMRLLQACGLACHACDLGRRSAAAPPPLQPSLRRRRRARAGTATAASARFSWWGCPAAAAR